MLVVGIPEGPVVVAASVSGDGRKNVLLARDLLSRLADSHFGPAQENTVVDRDTFFGSVMFFWVNGCRGLRDRDAVFGRC